MVEDLASYSDPRPGGYRDIAPLEAIGALGRIRFVDVREPDEFSSALGHIPGAELAPLSTITSAACAWDRDEPLVLVCRSGGRSARAAQAAGHRAYRDAVGALPTAAHLRAALANLRPTEAVSAERCSRFASGLARRLAEVE